MKGDNEVPLPAIMNNTAPLLTHPMSMIDLLGLFKDERGSLNRIVNSGRI
jgi:hypothetical protein